MAEGKITTLPTPDAGETRTVQVQPGQLLQLPPGDGPQAAVIAGNDLRIEWPDGASLILAGFVGQETPPALVFADGRLLSADELLTLPGVSTQTTLEQTASIDLAHGAFAIAPDLEGSLYQVTFNENGPGYEKLFATGLHPMEIALAPDGRLWGIVEQADGSYRLVIIDPAAETIQNGARIAALDSGSPVDGFTFAQDGALYLVQDATLYRLDGLDGEAPFASTVMTLDAYTGTDGLVSSGGTLFTHTPESHLLAIDPGNLTVHDLGPTGLETGSATLTAGPGGTLYLVGGQTAYEILPDAEGLMMTRQFTFESQFEEGGTWTWAGGVPLSATIDGSVLAPGTEPGPDAPFISTVEGVAMPAGDDGVTIHGDFGTLTMFQDGSYLYSTASLAGGEETFHFTVNAGDGEASTLNILVNGGSDQSSDAFANLHGDDFLFDNSMDDLLINAEGTELLAFSNTDPDAATHFDVGSNTLHLVDVLGDSGGIPGIEDLDVAVTVHGADVELAIHGSDGTTTVVLQELNSGGAFSSATSLQDLVDAGLKIEIDDGYAS